MLTLSESAVVKVKDIFAEENDADLKLRVFVQGGGCSGMQYGFTLDKDIGEDDFTIEFSGVTVLIDSLSGQYLQDAEVDYKESPMGSTFTIKNPNAQTTCGCGSSFNPY